MPKEIRQTRGHQIQVLVQGFMSSCSRRFAVVCRSTGRCVVLGLLLLALGRPIQALPNLKIESISVPPEAAVSDAIPVVVVVKNAGDSPTTVGSTVGMGPTSGTTFTGGFLGTFDMAPGLAPGASVRTGCVNRIGPTTRRRRHH